MGIVISDKEGTGPSPVGSESEQISGELQRATGEVYLVCPLAVQ